jgi:hypothetical protein
MVEATMGNARFFRRSGPSSLAVVTDAARGTQMTSNYSSKALPLCNRLARMK